MRKSAVAIPVIALVVGVFGFLIRKMEINTAFESATGFAKRNASSTTILIFMSVAVIVLALAFAILAGRRFAAESDFTKAFAPKGFAYISISFVLGLAWLAADVFFLLDKQIATGIKVIDIIWALMAVLSAISVIFIARGAYRGKSGSELLLFTLIPPLFFCFWLIVLYKDNAANPVLLSYGYQCLAIAAAALSFYFTAGFIYKKPATGRSLFSFLITIYFCAVVIADDISLPLKAIFGITMIHQFVNTVVFIRNLQPKDEI